MSQRLKVIFGNLVWFLASLPGLGRFMLAAIAPRWAQRRLARELGLLDGGFPDGVRVQGPAELEALVDRVRKGEAALLTREPVLYLMPTSGSTSASRLIPYTASLRTQFQAAVDPWLALLYLSCPSLCLGRQYWSLSPTTPFEVESRVPIGFGEETNYLNRWQRWAAPYVMAVPPEVVGAPEGFQLATLIHLVGAEDLALVSVWSPTFMLALLGSLPQHAQAIRLALSAAGRSKRAELFQRLDLADPQQWQQLWPELRVISCWTDGSSAPEALRLSRLFPQARLQPKGLLATEAAVSLPLGLSGRRVLAGASHYFEFVEEGSPRLRKAWELEEHKEYRVIVSTGGGLLRYDLRDRVRVTGHWLGLPCLEFIGREDLVSDLVGEKLNSRHVDSAIRASAAAEGMELEFAMLAPRRDGGQRRYCLFAKVREAGGATALGLALRLEAALAENYHYRHARAMGQLGAVELSLLQGEPANLVLARYAAQGRRLGEVKLEPLSKIDGWETVFEGVQRAAK